MAPKNSKRNASDDSSSDSDGPDDVSHSLKPDKYTRTCFQIIKLKIILFLFRNNQFFNFCKYYRELNIIE